MVVLYWLAFLLNFSFFTKIDLNHRFRNFQEFPTESSKCPIPRNFRTRIPGSLDFGTGSGLGIAIPWIPDPSFQSRDSGLDFANPGIPAGLGHDSLWDLSRYRTHHQSLPTARPFNVGLLQYWQAYKLQQSHIRTRPMYNNYADRRYT